MNSETPNIFDALKFQYKGVADSFSLAPKIAHEAIIHSKGSNKAPGYDSLSIKVCN